MKAWSCGSCRTDDPAPLPEPAGVAPDHDEGPIRLRQTDEVTTFIEAAGPLRP